MVITVCVCVFLRFHHQHHILLRLLHGDSTRHFIYIKSALHLIMWKTDWCLSRVPSSTSICLEGVWNLRPSNQQKHADPYPHSWTLQIKPHLSMSSLFIAPTEYSDHLDAPFSDGHRKKKGAWIVIVKVRKRNPLYLGFGLHPSYMQPKN